jgi:hypothetical protein
MNEERERIGKMLEEQKESCHEFIVKHVEQLQIFRDAKRIEFFYENGEHRINFISLEDLHYFVVSLFLNGIAYN